MRFVPGCNCCEPPVPVQTCTPCNIPKVDLDVTWTYGAGPTTVNLTAFLRSPPGPFPVPVGASWWEIPEQAWPPGSPISGNPNCPTFKAQIYCQGGLGGSGRLSLQTILDPEVFDSCSAFTVNQIASPGTFNCTPGSFFITFPDSLGIGTFIASD